MKRIASLFITLCVSFSAHADGGTIQDYMGAGVPDSAAKLMGELRGLS